MRSQAMEVRWEQAAAAERAVPAARRLPTPFVELGEADMGEAAALCDEAGLLGDFRAAVLKLAQVRAATR